jgi:alpha-D-ribose 1-methylphosphonate 5-triphosphate synthase subunit PhnG
VELKKKAELEGLSGAERKAKIDALCQEEVRRTLAEVRTEIQRQLDAKIERRRLQKASAD